jgi:hypothetical protein
VSDSKRLNRIFHYLLAYLLWFGAILLIGFDFLLLRSVISQWYIVLNFPANAHKAVDRFYLFVAGAIWIFLIFLIEGFFRDGVFKQDLSSRLKIVYGGGIAFAVVMAILQALLNLYVYLFAG